jgi:glycosyltransferase 2 family protein
MWPPAGAEQAEPVTAAAPVSRPRRGRQAVAFGVGALLLAFVVYYAGLGQIVRRLQELGWRAPLVLVPYLIVNIFDTTGWRRTLPRNVAKLVPFRALYLTRMAGEAVNSLTPTAAIGGEPVKAHMLRAWGVPSPDSIASVVISKTALTVSQITFVLIGLAALFDRLERRAAGAIWLSLLLAVAVAFTLFVVRLQRRGPVVTVWRWLHKIMPNAPIVARLEAKAAAIDERLSEFYVERAAFRSAALWHLGGWLLGVVEVWLFMALIDEPIALSEALIIEALAQPIRAASLIIPGGLGAQEIGGVALCSFLGIPEAAGVTLWLLKRARELVFDAVGVVYLMRRTGSLFGR